MQEKNIKEVLINVEEKVKLNFIDVLVIVATFGLIFFMGMFISGRKEFLNAK